MKLFFLSGLFLLLHTFFLFSQSKSSEDVKSLNIGDIVPNLYLGDVLNHSTLKKAHINDFKGKLLILDFWNIYCSTCIDFFPKARKLQEKFRDKIIILPVGFELRKPGEINIFLEKRKNTALEMKLPTAIMREKEIQLSASLFDIQGFPTEVWISPEGRLLAITDHLVLTESTIDSVLRGKQLAYKQQVFTTFIDGCEGIDNIPRITSPSFLDIGSRFTGYIDTIASLEAFAQKCTDDIVRLFKINSTVFQLYKEAYRLIGFDQASTARNKRIIVRNGKQPFYLDRYEIDHMDIWQKKKVEQANYFCYDLRLRPSYNLKDAATIMIQDLDRYLQINSNIERVKVKCLALVRTSSVDKIKYKPIPSPENPRDPFKEKLFGMPIFVLIELFNQYLDPIVLDETDYKERIDLPDVYYSKKYTLSELRTILNKYDLDLVEVERELPMLVLKDLRK